MSEAVGDKAVRSSEVQTRLNASTDTEAQNNLDGNPPIDMPALSDSTAVEKKPRWHYTKRQWTIFVAFCFINVGSSMCYSIQGPFYPKEAESKGVSSSVYGFVFGIFELVNFIVCPIFGRNINRIGPNLMLSSGNLIMSVSCICFGFLNLVEDGTTFIALSFTIRIVEAFGQSGFAVASYAIIAREFRANLASTFAVQETMYGLGLIAGPAAGGLLYELGGFLVPFLVVGSLLLVVSVITAFILPKTEKSSDRMGSLVKLGLLPGIAICYYTLVATAVVLGFQIGLLEPHIRQFGLSPSLNGLLFAITSLVYALTATVWGLLADKYCHHLKLLAGTAAIITIVGCLFLGPAPFLPLEPQVWTTIFALVLIGIGFGGEYVPPFLDSQQEAILKGYPDNIETYGMVSGLWFSGLALGCFIGPSIAGVLGDHFGFRNATLFLIVHQITVVFLCFGFYFMRKFRNQTEQTKQQTT